MGHHHDEAPVIHANALRGAAVLVLLTIVGCGYSVMFGSAEVMDPSTIVESRTLYFEDGEDGAVIVREGDEIIEVLASGDGQFVRGVLRAMARQRRLSSGGPEEPFTLVHWADGRVSIEDPVSGERVVLNAFGSENLQAFARLLDAEDRIIFLSSNAQRMEKDA